MLFCLEILVVVYVCISRKAKAATSHIHLVTNGYEKTPNGRRYERHEHKTHLRGEKLLRVETHRRRSHPELRLDHLCLLDTREDKDKIKQQAQQGTARHSKAQQAQQGTANHSKRREGVSVVKGHVF